MEQAALGTEEVLVWRSELPPGAVSLSGYLQATEHFRVHEGLLLCIMGNSMYVSLHILCGQFLLLSLLNELF